MTTPQSRVNTPTGLPPAPSWARYLNALAGTWLLSSAFLWHHASSSKPNTWAVGLLMAIAALWAISAPAIRWFNTVLAVWLALSTLAMTDIRPLTFYNNLIVAVVAFALSLVPPAREHRRT